MKLKKEYLILVLVIAALSVYLVMRSKDRTHFDLPQLATVESDKINRLIVTKGDRQLELKKEDDKWVIGPKAYAVDSIKIKNMVRTAADLTLTALVSESENYERYGLGHNQRIVVQAFAGQEMVRDFAIGRQAPTLQHTFVALTGDTKVFHARGNFDATYDHTVDEMRDETILKYEKSKITSLALTRGQTTATFTRKEKKPDTAAGEKPDQQSQGTRPEFQWVDTEGKEADTGTVDRLLALFSNLKCNDYLEDNAKQGLKDPVWTVTLKSDQNTHHLSIFGKEDEESIEFPAVSSGSPYAFILHKSRVETFEKAIGELLKPDQNQDKP